MKFDKEDCVVATILSIWTSGWAIYFDLSMFESILALSISLSTMLIIKYLKDKK